MSGVFISANSGLLGTLACTIDQEQATLHFWVANKDTWKRPGAFKEAPT
jgi:hypothetical protein